MTTGSERPSDAADALDFGDPLSMRSADDTDSGWGERTGRGAASSGGSGADAAADLARFLDEKPPHHL
ncbi:hypothetical protein GCM10012287_29900 [Streptomyces daqingensis]|uniref:Uncharacterized protein n=1 Tax=Streptomyces daqingensis TaxID=1472640 RepID=A0ABQ2MF04_9ACTN|nr:hypothetical protein [Streptomyces daqingensis]GGO50361.1 hypothetical protein GCM10012287_29900 [Streptomyces daqingensis]